MTEKRCLSRREFVATTVAAATAGAILPRCGSGGGSSGNTLPINATPIPPEQLTSLPFDPYVDRRVVRAYDRHVTSYSFGETEVAPLLVDADVLRGMLETSLCDLAREESIDEAWSALLPTEGGLSEARIAVKINLNGDEPEFINTSPAMVIALATSLTDSGVPLESITFFDRSRGVHQCYREAIDAAVPGAILLGADEVSVDESVRIEATSMVLPDGGILWVPAPVCLVEADHLINVHVLKGHFGGATGAMKNLFGLARNVWDTFHGRDDLGFERYERGHQCADLVAQPLIREKSRLLISEAVYGTWWHANKAPDRFRNEHLFPEGLPCSVIVGRNPLHHDMVLFDLLRCERDVEPLDEGYDFYPDDWLVHCAQEPFELGIFEHGRLEEGSVTAHDLAYDSIDYRVLGT